MSIEFSSDFFFTTVEQEKLVQQVAQIQALC